MITAIQPFTISEGFRMIIQADIEDEEKLFAQFQGLSDMSSAEEIANNITEFYYNTPFNVEF